MAFRRLPAFEWVTERSTLELRDTYHGFGESMGRAFELAVTPTLFGLAGYALDRWLGIIPVLTIVFVILAVIGLSVRMWCGYEERMKQHEAAGAWARAAPLERETRARAAPLERETRARAAPLEREIRARAAPPERETRARESEKV